MNQAKRLPFPSFEPDKPAGKFYIQPIRSFTAKGYWWSESVQWTLDTYIVNCLSPKIIYTGWGHPELKQEMGDFVRLEDGSICKCDECETGRVIVHRDRWTPWGEDALLPLGWKTGE